MRALPFPDPPLTDGTVALRPKRRSDSPALARALRDPEIPRWTSVPEGYTRTDADLWFERSEALRLSGDHLNLLVVDARDDERILGSVGLMSERPGVAEIGYLTVAGARRRGTATRALTLMRDWAASTLGFRRVEVLIHTSNAPSRRVAEKAGFADSGERRPQPRVEGAGADPTHAVYVWER